MNKEIWNPIPDERLEDYYLVSNLGRIKSVRLNRILTPHFHTRNYYYISCQHDGYRRNFLLHRLVAMAFVGNEDPRNTAVDHKNFNRKDNRAENLEWVTYKENSRRASVAGRMPKQIGQLSFRTHLKDEDVKKMFHLHDKGMTNIEIGKIFGVKQPCVSLILNGKRWGYMYEKYKKQADQLEAKLGQNI